MGTGDVYAVDAVPNCYYVDTGMYGTSGYGSVYIYDTERPAIVDTGIGTNYEYVLDAMAEIGIASSELASMLVTHVHLDHAGGAGFLAAETDADVYVHESGASFLADPEKLWEGTKAAVGEQIQFYTEPRPVPESRIEPIKEGSTIDLGSRTLGVHHAPGHAFHQVVFHDTDADAVFSADAAGIYARHVGTIFETSPPPGFDLGEVLDDARMIRRLDPETICYGHFGPADADGRLETYIDVITGWVESVEKKRAELEDDDAVVEHFVETSPVTDVWEGPKGPEEVRLNVRGVLHYLDSRSEE
ncbi:MBL fold metallo-hydrolase [Natronomonas sp. F2-12]|jgi:glyoxylase-like metal-dependent hydrolase (beta-lactamase superfamily II)|uniref:MBL fold metallo-hydrolase n=1 Tax=Natronomonas aquatica TaxID=2841590 RepID=A0A9R1D7Q3_9EURY|nr:MBL fold metallo-hydrolase [Natronomonas aquatica]MCQ4334045.1 MBL fold metallo-hydrolase [Natronomonas aquatica]